MRYKLHKANTTKQVLCSFVTDINKLAEMLRQTSRFESEEQNP
ncbi:MAG: hypothetical protein WCI53_10095 [Bacteroidota bacterium]|jgi:hypothetical protein